MSPPTIALCALLISIGTMALTFWNTVRSGQWRNSDDGKAVHTKIAALAEKVTVVETTLKTLPTAGDVARLTAVSESNHELLLITRSQLTRLENFFYEDKGK